MIQDLGIFSGMTPRTQETKEHINWTVSNLEATYASKETVV